MNDSVIILSRSEMLAHGLSHSEEAVLSVLRYVSTDGLWEGSYAELARLAGFCSRVTLQRTVQRLNERGLLLIEENGHKSVFLIVQNEKKERKEPKEIKKEKIFYIFLIIKKIKRLPPAILKKRLISLRV